MSVTFDFNEKVVLITGASSAIGAATAVLFAKSGADVVVTSAQSERLSEVAKECQSVAPNGGNILQVVADLTKAEEVKTLVERTIREFGKLDVLVNNAAIGERCGIADSDYLDTVRGLMDVNLTSVLALTKSCVPWLESSHGNIVNISSVAALQASVNGSPFSMTKSALDMFTKSMALELGLKDIRVNSVNPGAVRTQPKPKRGTGEADKCSEPKETPSPGRVGQPEDVAQAVLFLASDASAFISGALLVVDGGRVPIVNTKA